MTDAHTELTAPASRNVATGEFDFARARHLIDLKCSLQPGFELRWQLQLLMYWRMGLHPGNPGETLRRMRFEQFTELGVINPLRGHYLFIRVDEIPAAVIEYLDDVVLGFEHKAAAERSMPPVPQAAVPATGPVKGTGLRMLKKLYDLALSFDASALATGTCTVEDAKAAELAARAQQLYLRPITLLRDWPHPPQPNEAHAPERATPTSRHFPTSTCTNYAKPP